MVESLVNVAKRFFENIQNSAEGKAELSRFERVIEFELTDAEPFSVDVKNGTAKVTKGLSGVQQPLPLRFITDKEALGKLFAGKSQFIDVYTGQRERSATDFKGRMHVRESPTGGVGGTLGGPLVVWAGKLFRIGQELR